MFFFVFFSDLRLDDERIKELALIDIDNILRCNGRSLQDYPPLPIPVALSIENSTNLLMLEELDYDKVSLTEEFKSLYSKLTNEQLNIFNTIKDFVDNGCGGVFFVNGHGGTGKTFLWRVLTAALRSKGQIVLAGK